jgi:hypothetical protein
VQTHLLLTRCSLLVEQGPPHELLQRGDSALSALGRALGAEGHTDLLRRAALGAHAAAILGHASRNNNSHAAAVEE